MSKTGPVSVNSPPILVTSKRVMPSSVVLARSIASCTDASIVGPDAAMLIDFRTIIESSSGGDQNSLVGSMVYCRCRRRRLFPADRKKGHGPTAAPAGHVVRLDPADRSVTVDMAIGLAIARAHIDR